MNAESSFPGTLLLILLPVLKISAAVALLGLAFRLNKRYGIGGRLAANHFFGAVCLAFSAGGTLGMVWTAGLSSFDGWNAVPVVLAVLAGTLLLLPWGLFRIYDSRKDRAGLAADLVFTLAVLLPVSVLAALLAGSQ